MASLLSIGVSGLQVNQTALQVTGNNISNADIPGYSRQRAEMATRPEQLSGAGFVGSGSVVEDIDRVVNSFLLTQLRLDSSSFNSLDSFLSNIEQVDSLLADELSGLGPSIESFFAAIETGAEDPTSMPARQLVLSNAQGLVERLHTLYDRFDQQNLALNDQLDSLTSQATALAKGIAELNIAIEEEMGRGQGAGPNKLLDDRDELLRQLSEIVSIQTTNETGGSVNVFIGNGQPLVVGGVAGGMQTQPGESGVNTVDVYFEGATSSQNVTEQISGGKIGGLLEFREDTLNTAFNSLGRISIGLADTLNNQNQMGLDFEGNLGNRIFGEINAPNLIAERVTGLAGNGPATVTATITDVSQLSTSDYTLTFSSALDYQLIRDQDGTAVSGTLAGLPGTIAIDGVDIDIAGTSAGDKFFIRPTRTGADNITLDMQRPQELAYAAPIVTDARLGNTGTGVISPGEVTAVFDGGGAVLSEFATPGELSPPVLVRFTSPTSFDVINSSTLASISAGNAFIPGQVNTLVFGTPAAYQVEINGAPAAGDEFTIAYNADGTSDNRNAVELGALRINGQLDGGDLNYEDAYGRLIEEVGARTAQVRISRDASQSLLFQSQANRDSISGVNLDEEAANLIKFEQAYNASAQVISVARQIFDTLLSAFR